MNEQQVYDGFTGIWFKDGSKYYVGKESAADFEKYVKQVDVKVLDIIGYMVQGEDKVLSHAMIASHAEVPDVNKIVDLVATLANKLTHFNFVLEFK